MSLSPERMLILGAGVMGRGIALAAARAGYTVCVYDPHEAALEAARSYAESFLNQSVEKGKLSPTDREAALARLHFTADAAARTGSFLIEALPESLELKQRALADAEAQLGAEAILTSNTSTLPITRLAAALQRPERFAGMHFFNPAPVMRLVEVIAGARTAPETLRRVSETAVRMGKTPVEAQDLPGFIVNRAARPYYLESLRLLESGAASAEAIDRLLRSSGFPMGPFELMDLIGIDVNLAVSKSVYEGYFQAPRFRPSRLQQQLADAGLLGRKTGRGFYEYP
ncbi:MAG: 3-hydroxyacyl-CoA dehydrogenase NAD-binding domain-containing protein [Bacteroidia bacterium]|nr:3-hydroxyacyl-CoA dehydrogenase NAD-binding domain-containing protein [Bacteroidia bacterium]